MVPSFKFSYRGHVVQRTLIFYVAEQGPAEWGEFLCDVTFCFERLVLLPGRSGHLAGKQTNPALHPHKVSSLQEAACVSLYRNTELKRPSGDGMRCPWPWRWSSETPRPSAPRLGSCLRVSGSLSCPRPPRFLHAVLLHLLPHFCRQGHWQGREKNIRIPSDPPAFRSTWRWLKKWLTVLSGARQRVVSASFF